MLTGWDELDAAFLDGHGGALDRVDLERFWDGGQPEWPHALAPAALVPRRQVVTEALAAVEAAGASMVVLLVGPGGSGKSTAIRQLAADLARRPDRRVLFRAAGAPLVPESVLELDEGTQWILASDDADEIAPSVATSIEVLAGAPRLRVHWVLAARDTDWQQQFPRGEPWGQQVGGWPEPAARSAVLSVTEVDASAIAATWGGDDMRALVAAPTLLSGVLGHRVADLAGHVRRTLASLDPAPNAAFRAAAAAAAVGVDGIDLRVAADLAATPRPDRFALRAALGRVGLGTGTGEALRVRDSSLAPAAVSEMGDDLGAVLTDLVRTTAEVARQTRPLVSDVAIVAGAPTLAGRLRSLDIAEAEAHAMACAAADVAARALDNLLMTALFRSRTYRAAGDPAKADDILRAALATAASTEDWADTARGFVAELSLAMASPEGGLVVAGLALADLRGIRPVVMVEARAPLARVGERCSSLLDDGDPYRRLLRAVAWFGRRVVPNFDPAKQDFRRHAARADELGVAECSPAEAAQWLAEGIAAAFAAADDPSLAHLLALVLPDGSLTFTQLQQTAARSANLVG